jgi:hypothetical protein
MADSTARAPSLRLPVVPADAAAPAPSRRATRPLERTDPTDTLHDYTLVPYDPVEDPTGKLRAVNALVESFALAGVEEEGARVIDLLRTGLGPERTVFGVKFLVPDDADVQVAGWELYFYDPPRERADLDIGAVASLLSPALFVDARPPRALPWHMFSVEFGVPHLRERAPAAVDVYVGTNPRQKGTDRSYKLRGEQLVFENVYTFHDPSSEVDELLYRLRYGVHFSRAEHPLSALIPPELFRCGHICVANKRHADALYFSRITTDQLLFALKFLGFRGELPGWLAAHASLLGHLLWDIGFDFVCEGGRLRFRKGGLYGSF